tara:strand:+ start:434 stop:958 length:525 start_codon:yes stop_codon:yes gene_type:complete
MNLNYQNILKSSKGQTNLIVVPQIENNARYEVYIDGIKRENYQFIKLSEEYSYKEIRILLLEGSIKISDSACWAIYPTFDNNIIPLKQSDYCDWFFSETEEVNKWYNAPYELNFLHIFLQGPSYFKGIKPIYDYQPTLLGDPKLKKENTEKLLMHLGLQNSTQKKYSRIINSPC